jgi:hypothetical protein
MHTNCRIVIGTAPRITRRTPGFYVLELDEPGYTTRGYLGVETCPLTDFPVSGITVLILVYILRSIEQLPAERNVSSLYRRHTYEQRRKQYRQK